MTEKTQALFGDIPYVRHIKNILFKLALPSGVITILWYYYDLDGYLLHVVPAIFYTGVVTLLFLLVLAPFSKSLANERSSSVMAQVVMCSVMIAYFVPFYIESRMDPHAWGLIGALGLLFPMGVALILGIITFIAAMAGLIRRGRPEYLLLFFFAALGATSVFHLCII